MNLPAAPDGYDRANEQAVRRQIEAADDGNFKKGEDVRLERGERLLVSGDVIDFTGLPTADPAVAGRLWNDAGALKISAG